VDSFDLHKLTDFDFETLCKDILEEILDVRLEIFSQGPDMGIDLRHTSADGSITVIQCKHWIKTDRSTFIRRMKRDELPKVTKLGPDRYIIAASVPMSPQAKEILKADFAPHIKTPSDILGLEDITAFLAGRPDIVRRHIRLWLNDVTVLESALSRNVLWRSEHFVEEIQETLRTYVPNPSFRQALGVLEDSHVCVISGLPGVGKTTLARVLAANYADQGYELIHISGDIEDAYRLWSRGARQLFIYDDFLGQSVLDDKLNKNEDQRLISIMKRVKGDSRKRLICTTRGYILEQARQRYERLHNEDFSPITFTVQVEQYDREVRAAILYNHLFWSDWPAAIKAMFASPDSYGPIIDHVHFNPRIIAATLSADFDSSLGHPAAQLVDNLSDPALVWRHIYELQLSQWERDLLTTFFSMQTGRLPNLEQVLLARPGWTRSQVRRSLQVLDGTFLSVRQESVPVVDFHNASASEFVAGELFSHPSELRKVLSVPHAFEQIEKLWFHFAAKASEGGDFWQRGNPYSDILVSAVMDSLDSPKEPYKSKPSSSVVLPSLELAEYSRDRKLIRRVVELLSTQGTVYRIRRFEDILNVIRSVRDSRIPEIRACYNKIRLEGLSAVLNREKGRAAPVKAALYVQELTDLIDESLRERISNTAVEVASRILDDYEWGWGDVDFVDVEAALQFADLRSPRESIWAGWEDLMASEDVEAWRGIGAGDTEPDYEEWEEYDDDDYKGDRAYELMQSLASLDEISEE
jgi:hypothetical protein